MALHNVSETDSFATNVQMPADGDPADSSDFEASTIKPLTDRSRWCKLRLDPWVTGGTLTLPGDSTNPLTIIAGTIGFDNTGLSDDAGLKLGDGATGGVLMGPYSKQGGTGRQPKKVVAGTPATNQTVNPRYTDLVRYNPSAAIELAILTDADYVTGDHFRVVNVSATSGRTITVKDPGGATIYVVPIASGSRTSWVDIVYDGANWVECGSLDANA
jgi:hypothetical protein